MSEPFRIGFGRGASSGEDRTVVPRGAKGIDVDLARHGAGTWLQVAVQDSGRHDRGEVVLLGESPG